MRLSLGVNQDMDTYNHPWLKITIAQTEVLGIMIVWNLMVVWREV